MTVRTLFSILRRRWYIMVIGVGLAIVAFITMNRAGGVYTTEASVIFSPPGAAGVAPVSDGYQETLVAFTAAVEREYDNGREADRLAENATLYGAGVARGSQVLLPNSGGQWQTSFATPALDVKIVGPSPAWVQDELNRIVDRISSIARRQQAEQGVAAKNYITTALNPEQPDVSYVGSLKSTQARALAALLVLGLGLSAFAATLVDSVVARRRTRRTETLVRRQLMTQTQGGTR